MNELIENFKILYNRDTIQFFCLLFVFLFSLFCILIATIGTIACPNFFCIFLFIIFIPVLFNFPSFLESEVNFVAITDLTYFSNKNNEMKNISLEKIISENNKSIIAIELKKNNIKDGLEQYLNSNLREKYIQCIESKAVDFISSISNDKNISRKKMDIAILSYSKDCIDSLSIKHKF